MSKSTWIDGKRAFLTEDTAVITQHGPYDVSIAVRRIWETPSGEQFVKIEGMWMPLWSYRRCEDYTVETYHKVVEVI